jgi:hypothetical protein
MTGLSVPTVQRMEASDGVVRGTIESLMKIVEALDAAGIELIAENATSSSGVAACGWRRSADPANHGRRFPPHWSVEEMLVSVRSWFLRGVPFQPVVYQDASLEFCRFAWSKYDLPLHLDARGMNGDVPLFSLDSSA